MSDDNNYEVSNEALKQLAGLIKELEQHEGPWWEDRSVREGKTVILDSWSDPLAHKFMKFLYDNNLIVDFDWGSWQEGRDFFKDSSSQKYEKLNKLFILKLLTAVARNSRFNEGAWANLFETGEAQQLFKKLLVIESSNSE